MWVNLLALRTGIFAEGRFLGKLVDDWTDDTLDFLHTKLEHLLVVACVAYLLSRLLTLITQRMIRVAEQHAAGTNRVAQVKTLAGVIHTTGVTAITVITGMLILGAVGINLAPLLASAGIVGVAIGLAAQSLVKDALNGVFILIEDQFNVGDTVRIAGVTGTIETMTLRKTTVRDADGTLYVIPNSQISTVANLSAGYSASTINVSVDFSADPDKVFKLLSEIALEIRNSEEFRQLFVDDPQILGIDAIKGSELIFAVSFKTLATKQYGPLREFRRRVRLALEQNHLLPGDPFRVFSDFDNAKSITGARTNAAAAQAAVDPTTLHAQELNPFTGE